MKGEALCRNCSPNERRKSTRKMPKKLASKRKPAFLRHGVNAVFQRAQGFVDRSVAETELDLIIARRKIALVALARGESWSELF